MNRIDFCKSMNVVDLTIPYSDSRVMDQSITSIFFFVKEENNGNYCLIKSIFFMYKTFLQFLSGSIFVNDH